MLGAGAFLTVGGIALYNKLFEMAKPDKVDASGHNADWMTEHVKNLGPEGAAKVLAGLGMKVEYEQQPDGSLVARLTSAYV